MQKPTNRPLGKTWPVLVLYMGLLVGWYPMVALTRNLDVWISWNIRVSYAAVWIGILRTIHEIDLRLRRD